VDLIIGGMELHADWATVGVLVLGWLGTCASGTFVCACLVAYQVERTCYNHV
jgi:hypothetical protein